MLCPAGCEWGVSGHRTQPVLSEGTLSDDVSRVPLPRVGLVCREPPALAHQQPLGGGPSELLLILAVEEPSPTWARPAPQPQPQGSGGPAGA